MRGLMIAPYAIEAELQNLIIVLVDPVHARVYFASLLNENIAICSQ